MRRTIPERVGAILRLDWSVYEEIERDPYAIPQAFAVVAGASLVAGLGQGFSPLVFLWTAISIGLWALATALIWAAGLLLADDEVDYVQVLRCTGFAYSWLALQIGAGLPWIGWIFAWASIAMELVALFQATRHSMDVGTKRAAAICALAFGLPAMLMWLVVG